jgi:predicted GIY-YIG superfamily endonuclease
MEFVDAFQQKQYYVYKISNRVNDKLYIGATNCFERRWEEHKYACLSGSNKPLYVAMRAYGIDEFLLAVIERCDNEHLMYKRERELIQSFHTVHPHGYNLKVRKLTDADAAIIKFDAYHLKGTQYARLFGMCPETVYFMRKNASYDTYHYITREHLPVDIDQYRQLAGHDLTNFSRRLKSQQRQ